jgi:hypothetical protein
MVKAARAPSAPKKEVDPEAQAQRLRRLSNHPAACTWLEQELGLARGDLEREGFGLDLPYTSQVNGIARGPWVTLPARDKDGRRLASLCKLAIPNVSGGINTPWWKAGDCLTFFLRPRQHDTVLVASLPDLCRLFPAAALLATDVIASTDADRIPGEWKTEDFWRGWAHIVLAPGSDPAGAIKLELSQVCRTRIRTLQPSEQNGLREILASGLRIDSISDERTLLQPSATGDSHTSTVAFRPIDLSKPLSDGRLHYSFETIARVIEPTRNGPVEAKRRTTMVVRSDGEILSVEQVPAPRGTPSNQRLFQLSDGTLLNRHPRVPACASWSWASIQAFVAHPEQAAAPLAELLRETEQIMRQHIYLPKDDDFAVLALAVAASYVQPVFRALPIILVTGPAGSGKSTAGVILAALGRNGTLIGQVSAAAAARVIDETSGLVVLDDLEGVAARSGRASFSDLIQWLKVSYNRDTAVKAWVDAGRSMRVERLNGFGMKVITNTRGADPTLATRMLVVPTAGAPEAASCADVSELDAGAAADLRDRFHIWAFKEHARVADVYGRVCARTARQRADEIAAPFRALAELSGDARLGARLERSITTVSESSSVATPLDLLRTAITRLSRSGYADVAPTQILLEMRSVSAERHGAEQALAALSEVDPEWVGRQIRSLTLVEASQEIRRRVRGRNLRFLRLRGAVGGARRSGDFCSSCERCPYSDLGCPLK